MLVLEHDQDGAQARQMTDPIDKNLLGDVALPLGADFAQRVGSSPGNAKKIGKDRQSDVDRDLAD